ncbi:hypothetical protein K491DRAFT_476005 [Lophiostoma macrostomum CBS 122681]|uniref:Uncharacterized protein n=1 Tax=Lophiostoma macrostomum CBS 122681 TaxID=1314788 RepID=A0A6A6T560_9PLEO|nr:hypothetical protein K491DRAFT_476005 [Lophiostoma macrostomum CBS 122681]
MSVFHSLLVACAFLSIAADCTPFRRDGNSTTVSGWNHTSSSTSSVAPSPLTLASSPRTTSLPLPTSSTSSASVVIEQSTRTNVASHPSSLSSNTLGATSAPVYTTSVVAFSSASNFSNVAGTLSSAGSTAPSTSLSNSSSVASGLLTGVTSRAPYPIPSTGSSLGHGTGVGTGIGTGGTVGTGISPGSINGTGYAKPTAQGFNSTSASRNGTGPCTVNIPSANADWWYAATYGYAIGTLSRVGGNFTDAGQHLTFVSNTDTFDITSALSDPVFTPSVTYDTEYNFTWTVFNEYTVIPAATVTSFVSQTAYIPLPSDNIILEADFTNYNLNVDDLPSATLTVAEGDGTILNICNAIAIFHCI